MRGRITAMVVFFTVVCAPTAALAQATTAEARDQIVLSGDAVVPRGTVADEVVVFSGSATIAGVAQGDVVVLEGPVTIAGQVGGDVVGLHGQVKLLNTAQVTGDVLAGGPFATASGSRWRDRSVRSVRWSQASRSGCRCLW
jgi:hypothetical protein